MRIVECRGHAYCDDELDAVNALSLETRMAGEPRLVAERERIRALKLSIKRLPQPPTPALLRRKVQAIVSKAAPRACIAADCAMAASVVAAGFLSAATTWMVLVQMI